MIDWTKYFDKIICICYSGYNCRKQLLQYQLKRVGILDSGIFEWHITFQDQYLANFRKTCDIKYSLSYLSDTKGHLDAVKKAYYQGCNKILIIEDDIRFLKDLNKIEQILENIPNNNEWDLILFNKATQNTYIEYFNLIKNKKNRLNNYFCKFKNAILFSGGCYCLNKKGMELLFENFNICNFLIIDIYWSCLHLFNKKIFSITDLAVQALFEKAENYNHVLPKCDGDWLSATLHIQQCYQRRGIDFNDYMIIKDGSTFNYGDYIKEQNDIII